MRPSLGPALLLHTHMPTSDYTPETLAIAAKMRTRLVDENGNDFDDFTEETTPTKVQVQESIATILGEVSSAVGADLPTADLDASAMGCVVLGTVADLELTYWPEQVNSSQNSPYDAWAKRYDNCLKRLVEAVEVAAGGGDGPLTAGSGGLPSYSFPEDAGGMVGWGTGF